ncbi:hypothetical protein ACRAQ6_11990 [Erythrobacter sp. HA6-11]
MVKRTGTYGEICEASRDVVEAHLDAADEKNYRLWHAFSEMDCYRAKEAGFDSYPDTKSTKIQFPEDASLTADEIEAAAGHAMKAERARDEIETAAQPAVARQN